MITFIVDNGLALGLLGITLILVFIGWNLKRLIFKQLAFNLAAVVCALFLYELYLDFSHKGSKKEIWVNDLKKSSYGDHHPQLGYAPKPDSMNVRVKRYNRKKVLYDVNYGLVDGHRRIKPDKVQDTAWAGFMGGSFTFGEGLNDEETLPAQFNRRTDGFFKTINFGYHGYGPHHALRLLDIAAAAKGLNPDHQCRLAFYLFIPDHVRRAAGYASWDTNGPRYELQNDSLRNAGQFSGETRAIQLDNKWVRILREMWRRSAIAYKHFRNEKVEISKQDIQLTVAILRRIHELWRSDNVEFTVLFDHAIEDWKWKDEFIRLMQNEKIPFVNLANHIHAPQHELYIEGDGHPTAAYNQWLADYLVKEQVPYLCR